MKAVPGLLRLLLALLVVEADRLRMWLSFQVFTTSSGSTWTIPSSEERYGNIAGWRVFSEGI